MANSYPGGRERVRKRRGTAWIAAILLSLTMAASQTATAGPPKIDSFSATSTSGAAPFQVSFGSTFSCTQPACRWSLDFGDGRVASGTFDEWGPVPHRYESAGTFYVQLTVSDDYGSDSKSLLVTVIDPPPEGGGATNRDGTVTVLAIAVVAASAGIVVLLLVLRRTRLRHPPNLLPSRPPPPR